MAKQEDEGEGQIQGEASRKKVVKLARSRRSRPRRRPQRTACRAVEQAYGQAGKALDGVQDPRLHPRAVGPDLHAAARLHSAPTCIKVERPGVGDITRGQLRDVKGADSLYFTMLNDNKRSITIDSKHPEGQGDPRAAGQALRRAGRELRARRARPHGADLGAHPQAQPAHDRRVGEGLRPRPLRGLQGLRERRAMRRRLGLDHRLPRRPAARHRRADRRQRHRPASRARHRHRALSAHHAPAAARRCSAPCRTACSTSRA